MTWLRGSPVKRSQRLIDSIYDGEVRTTGQLKSWVESAAALPPKLREYVFQKIEPGIGPTGVSYLRSLLPIPGAMA